ncbi:MAG: CsgG/HfaB family protein, partial [Prevotellaceae bacterium]|nr:CsgG/HfaB family protein [Prevotellaceae bacterium]
MKKSLIIGIYLLWCCGATAQESQKVAIFDPAGDVSASYKEIVREEISNIIVNTGKFTVLERQLINKVLEENKFQMGGLVDDSQVGEIGKRMGANYVFVTSISPMGQNLYLSFKLIDVQTARIEKQKTGRTTKGSADLVEVTQTVVGEMFAEAKQVAKPIAVVEPEPEVKPVPKTAPETLFKNSVLTAEGGDVFAEGEKLSKKQIRGLMAKTESLKLYNKGKSRRNKGTAMVWTSVLFPAAGFALGWVIYDGYSHEYVVEGNKVYESD